MKYKILLDTDSQIFTVINSRQQEGTGITIQQAIKNLNRK